MFLFFKPRLLDLAFLSTLNTNLEGIDRNVQERNGGIKDRERNESGVAADKKREKYVRTMDQFTAVYSDSSSSHFRTIFGCPLPFHSSMRSG